MQTFVIRRKGNLKDAAELGAPPGYPLGSA